MISRLLKKAWKGQTRRVGSKESNKPDFHDTPVGLAGGVTVNLCYSHSPTTSETATWVNPEAQTDVDHFIRR